MKSRLLSKRLHVSIGSSGGNKFEVAIHASIIVVRTFMRMRTMLAEHEELKRRLQDIERRLAQGFAEHEKELQENIFLISQLERPTENQKKSRLGF